MITVNGIKLEPTIFPDGTSQVWKLHPEIIDSDILKVDWRFEFEREIVFLYSLRRLRPRALIYLNVPYLPYGRQDKEVSNTTTFNLWMLGDLLNPLKLAEVRSLDAHNPEAAHFIIHNFVNQEPTDLHARAIKEHLPNVLIFPDEGAERRYRHLGVFPKIVMEKTRDQASGIITGHQIKSSTSENRSPGLKFLIVDDICDGGATFVSIAEMIHRTYREAKIWLFVTHGIFSQGRARLEDQGIYLLTTNSLPRNEPSPDNYEV